MDLILHLKHYIQPRKLCTANIIFHICTKATFVIFTVITALLSSYTYFGSPIRCIVQRDVASLMQNYCWYYGTHTLPNSLLGDIGKNIIQPGVTSDSKFNNSIKYHRYYQWVCLALCMNAVLSYLPRLIWKTLENGRLKKLCENLHDPTLKKDIKEKRILGITTYFSFYVNQQSTYASNFFCCELLNFAVAIGQFYLTDRFLDGEFFNYGIDVIFNHTLQPMDRIFPKITKCNFHLFGSSGSLQKYDGLCILTINIINEKIYLFLWFWFAGMVILSSIAILYRVLICCSSKLRLYLLVLFRARFADRNEIECILRHFDVGDWFLFYQICKNVDSVIFEEICRKLKLKLKNN